MTRAQLVSQRATNMERVWPLDVTPIDYLRVTRGLGRKLLSCRTAGHSSSSVAVFTALLLKENTLLVATKVPGKAQDSLAHHNPVCATLLGEHMIVIVCM